MKDNREKLIIQLKKNSKKEKLKVSDLHRQIQEYEGIIDALSFSENSNLKLIYRERINQCYTQLEEALNTIERNRKLIYIIQSVNVIVDRGEKCA